MKPKVKQKLKQILRKYFDEPVPETTKKQHLKETIEVAEQVLGENDETVCEMRSDLTCY